MKNSDISNRMKRYEEVSKVKLMRRTPVIVRLDGKAFHTFTKTIKAEKPYCDKLKKCFVNSIINIFNDVQGLKLAYCQSDEVSLLLTDYSTIKTEAYFDYNVQKITSVISSMFSVFFYIEVLKHFDLSINPFFDCRCFNVPKEDIVNYFIWRQKDATRNSISSFSQSMFSHKKLQGLNSDELQDLMFIDYGFNWNDVDIWKKRGYCIYKKEGEIFVDNEMPVLTNDRLYIEQFI